MACKNLRGEMAKAGVKIEDLAALLKIHRNSVSNKLNGDSSFTIEEAFLIQTTYFTDYKIEYLFAKE